MKSPTLVLGIALAGLASVIAAPALEERGVRGGGYNSLEPHLLEAVTERSDESHGTFGPGSNKWGMKREDEAQDGPALKKRCGWKAGGLMSCYL